MLPGTANGDLITSCQNFPDFDIETGHPSTQLSVIKFHEKLETSKTSADAALPWSGLAWGENVGNRYPGGSEMKLKMACYTDTEDKGT